MKKKQQKTIRTKVYCPKCGVELKWFSFVELHQCPECHVLYVVDRTQTSV